MAATFPLTALADAPTSGTSVSTIFSTEVVTTRSGREQRRALWNYPRHQIAPTWERTANSPALVDTLWAFYCARKGSFSPFVYFDFDPDRTWADAHVGVGDGTTLVFNAPSMSATGVVVKVDGVTKTLTTHYTFAAGTGLNGRDQITFTAGNAPAVGKAVTVTFKGRRAFMMRFAEDALDYRAFEVSVYSLGLKLFEVRGEG